MELSVINKCENAYSLLYDFYQTIGTKKTEKELIESIKKFLTYGDVIAARIDDKIIAMLNLYCNNTQTLEAYICDVYVFNEFRRQALAKKMMLEAIQICHNRKFKHIRLHVKEDNNAAISLYSSLGFVNTENTDEKFKHLQEMVLIL